MGQGSVPVDSYKNADLIIFNTCSVRQHAEDRVWGKMGELKRLRKRGTPLGVCPFGDRPIFGLVGCMAKAYGKDVFKRLPHIDFVCGPANIYDIPDIVEKVKKGERHIVAIDKESRPVRVCGRDYLQYDTKASVNISQGCNNFCSYCIVPYLRGREVHRPYKLIIDEIKGLVDKGIKEVVLLGQNVNSYNDNGVDFPKLLQKVNNVPGLLRIGFMTSHPKDANEELFEAMAGLDKVCEHLHLPMQCGSDRILKMMNRNYTASHYLKLVELFRKIIPTSSITTDIIVGFPGEAEEDFKKTYSLMKRIEFNSAFIFKYSQRPFTKALSFEDDVLNEDKQARNQILLNLQSGISKKKNNEFINTVQEALAISSAMKDPSSQIKAMTRLNQRVVFIGGKELIGKLIRVKITGVKVQTLLGEIV
ncbi:MAG: tRNA (N6-isopentenyl adenosine(37)-C2)-methylthiotransferase MiaB, partial [Candidatus Omnitrophota bacterium]